MLSSSGLTLSTKFTTTSDGGRGGDGLLFLNLHQELECQASLLHSSLIQDTQLINGVQPGFYNVAYFVILKDDVSGYG